MGIVSSAAPGGIGLILDVEPSELPAEAWSSVENMRFYARSAKTMLGDQQLAVTSEQMEYAISAQSVSGVGASWLLASDTKAWALQGQTLTDVTPTAVAGISGSFLNWSGGSLGGLCFLNNGMQKPWVWMSNNPATPMVELANWPADTTAKTLRAFKQYLVALSVSKPGGNYPTLVKWSHPADPGVVPPSWDEADPTKDAGEYPLAETPGACVDCLPLRDVNIIYKTDSVWGMQYIGGVFIFRFYKIFGDFGMPVRNCAVEYTSGKHFVFTGTDIVIHDGNSSRSVATTRVKGLFRTISANQLQATFVVSHPAMNEVWFCWRRADDGKIAADTALVFNHLDETWSIRDLPDYRYIGTGVVEPQETAELQWDTISSGWDGSGIAWGEYASIPAFMRLLGVGELELAWVDGTSVGAEPAVLERTYVGVPMQAGKPPDLSMNKFISMIWPRIKGPLGMELLITFGTADTVSADINWRPSKTYTIGVTKKLPLTLTGKMLAVRLETKATSPVKGVWSYHGFDMDIQPAGVN